MRQPTNSNQEHGMSIGSIGSNSTSSTVALQKQLKADQKTLSEDEAKKASQKTLETDQAKVTADQQAIDAAQVKAKTAKGSSDGKGVTVTAAPSTTPGVVNTSTNGTAAGSVDISV
jgi:hypothetical protein